MLAPGFHYKKVCKNSVTTYCKKFHPIFCIHILFHCTHAFRKSQGVKVSGKMLVLKSNNYSKNTNLASYVVVVLVCGGEEVLLFSCVAVVLCCCVDDALLCWAGVEGSGFDFRGSISFDRTSISSSFSNSFFTNISATFFTGTMG